MLLKILQSIYVAATILANTFLITAYEFIIHVILQDYYLFPIILGFHLWFLYFFLTLHYKK